MIGVALLLQLPSLIPPSPAVCHDLMPSPPRLGNNALQLVDLPLRAAERAKL